MKRIILLLYLACLTLLGYAQVPSEVLAAYNQVVNTFKNYEIIPEEYCSEDDYYTLQPTKIVYKHPNIQLSFTSKLEDGVWLASGDKSGTYTLVLPIASTKFDFLDYNYSSDLRISNSTGIEFIRSNGKRKIIEQYSFSGTRLTIKKLYDEMIYLQKLLIENGYKGNLGIASSTNTTTSKSSKAATASSSMKYYKEAGFAIKNTYVLEENTVYRETVEKIEQSEFKLVAAYVCAQNIEKNNPNLINLISIHVNELLLPPKEILKGYKDGLIANRIPCVEKTWNGLIGVEYSFKQDMGEVMLPTKAFYGYKGNRGYLIQMASLTNCEEKYNQLLNSMIIL